MLRDLEWLSDAKHPTDCSWNIILSSICLKLQSIFYTRCYTHYLQLGCAKSRPSTILYVEIGPFKPTIPSPPDAALFSWSHQRQLPWPTERKPEDKEPFSKPIATLQCLLLRHWLREAAELRPGQLTASHGLLQCSTPEADDHGASP